jgi:tetratricopeptide (TPR) repeat protein
LWRGLYSKLALAAPQRIQHNRRVRAFVVFTALGIAATPCLARAESFDELVAQAQVRHDAFDLAGALAACERAHGLEPARLEGLTCLSHMHNDIGVSGARRAAEPHYLKAIEYATQAQSKYPDKAVAQFWAAASYGNLALLKGGKEKVRLARNLERDAKRAIELDPSFAPPYVALGIYYRELAELGWFLRQFAKILVGSIPPGSKEDSLRMLQKAVELSPGDVLAQYELGRTYESMGRRKEAADQYRKLPAMRSTEPRDANDKADASARLRKLAR